MKNLKGTLHWLIMGLFLLGCGANKNQDTEQLMHLLVGTYTNGDSKGIYQLSLNTQSGELSAPLLLVETPNPSYLVKNTTGDMVFAVNEEGEGMLSGFKYDQDNGQMTLIGQLPTGGVHPCYVDLNDDENRVVVANYSSGNVSFFDVKPDGTADMFQIFQHRGTGPNTERQEGPHAHCSLFHGNFAYAVDLGTDQIISYAINSQGIGASRVAFELEPGDGPRHIVFNADGDLAFVINELSNTVMSLKPIANTGTFEAVSRASTLPNDFTDHSQCADIQLIKDGKFLYASNRGHDSIAIFSVSEGGDLERISVESTRGEWPRNFVISPDGQHLLVANQYTNNIVVFAIDQATGLLTYTGNQAEIGGPVCLKF